MKVIIPDVRPWRHDLAGCLHACAGTLLDHLGMPVLGTLGTHWGFYYPPGDFRQEEYYFPCPPGASLLGCLAPYHPVSSRWHTPRTAAEGWSGVRERVAAGSLVAVAVDNYQLPFRPAYQDVHSNHLVIVYGFDDEDETARVLDAVPPRFDGDLPLAVLAAARDSGNRAQHDRDMFFAGSDIANRWLDVTVDRDRIRPRGQDAVASYLRRNLAGFDAPDDDEDHVGLAGMRDFLRGMERRLIRGDEIADELFVVAGSALAVTAVHADWLAEVGAASGLPRLQELARSVERVAHHWTALRIAAALTRKGDVTAGRLRRRHDGLLADTERALGETESVITEL
jgi:hypothetical protein